MEPNPPIKQARLPESAQVWDSSDHQFVEAFRKDFKRQKTLKLIDAVTFNATTTNATGKLFEVPAYSNALICCDVDVIAVPTDILIDIQFSFDRIKWFKYMLGPFGDLRYEDAAGDKKECLPILILAPFMRGYAIATGTGAVNMFKLSVYAILNG